MRSFIRVMKALSDPNRVKIIKLLENNELCVCEIHSLLGLAQSTVSKHLKILEEADLVNFEVLMGCGQSIRRTNMPHSMFLCVIL